MSKIFGFLFVLNLILLVLQLSLGIDVHLWQFMVTGAMGGMWQRGRAEAKRREAQIGSVYSHYDPKTYKAPTRYHEM